MWTVRRSADIANCQHHKQLFQKAQPKHVGWRQKAALFETTQTHIEFCHGTHGCKAVKHASEQFLELRHHVQLSYES